MGDEDLYIQDDLELGSQGFKPGGGMWAAPSDARLKKDIHPYTDGLTQILQIQPYRYKYNDKVTIYDPDKEHVGILAQDMKEIAPYMVELTPLGQVVEEDENGNERIVKEGTPYFTYDGSALTYMLVNAVKEQQKTIDAQNITLAKLRHQNELLNKGLMRIEKQLGNQQLIIGN